MAMSLAAEAAIRETLKSMAEVEAGAKETDSPRIARALDRLAGVDMTVLVLNKTKVGAVVAGLRSHVDTSVSNASKALIAKWKAIAEASGVRPAAGAGGIKGGGTASPLPSTTSAGSGSRATIATATSDAVLTASPSTASSVLSSASAALQASSTGAGSGAGSNGSAPGAKSVSRVRSIGLLTDMIAKAVMAEATKVAPATSTSTCVGGDSSPVVGNGGGGGGGDGTTWPDAPCEADIRCRSEEVANGLETEIWQRVCRSTAAPPSSPAFDKEYAAVMRTFLLALPRNTSLLCNMFNRLLPLDHVAGLSADELVSSDAKAAAEAMRKEHEEARMLDWKSKNRKMILAVAGVGEGEGTLKCKKCGGHNTEYTEVQTRSADEPTTKKCFCHDCGTRWTFNG